MTKLEQVAQGASALNDEQLDGLVAYIDYLAGEAVFSSVPAAVRASIDRGLAERDGGRVKPAEDVFARLQAKLDAERT